MSEPVCCSDRAIETNATETTFDRGAIESRGPRFEEKKKMPRGTQRDECRVKLAIVVPYRFETTRNEGFC